MLTKPETILQERITKLCREASTFLSNVNSSNGYPQDIWANNLIYVGDAKNRLDVAFGCIKELVALLKDVRCINLECQAVCKFLGQSSQTQWGSDPTRYYRCDQHGAFGMSQMGYSNFVDDARLKEI